MAMNRIQFQAGLSMREFQRQYGADEQCEAALFTSRWPNGWSCSRCQCTRFACTHNGRRLWECLACGYQSSSIVGTVFEHTKLALSVWFLAIYLMTQSKNAVSALELKRQLGVSYKTAWLMKHKLLQTMLLREEPRRLDERVEVDDAYPWGREGGQARARLRKQDRICGSGTNQCKRQATLHAAQDGRRIHQRGATTMGAKELSTYSARGLRWFVVLCGGYANCCKPRTPCGGSWQASCAAPRVSLGQYDAGKPQNVSERHLPFDQARQICRPLPGRVCLSVQPTFRFGGHGAPLAARSRYDKAATAKRAADV